MEKLIGHLKLYWLILIFLCSKHTFSYSPYTRSSKGKWHLLTITWRLQIPWPLVASIPASYFVLQHLAHEQSGVLMFGSKRKAVVGLGKLNYDPETYWVMLLSQNRMPQDDLNVKICTDAVLHARMPHPFRNYIDGESNSDQAIENFWEKTEIAIRMKQVGLYSNHKYNDFIQHSVLF